MSYEQNILRYQRESQDILLSCKYFLDQSRQKAVKINIIAIKTRQNSAYCSAILSCCDPLISPRTPSQNWL